MWLLLSIDGELSDLRFGEEDIRVWLDDPIPLWSQVGFGMNRRGRSRGRLGGLKLIDRRVCGVCTTAAGDRCA